MKLKCNVFIVLIAWSAHKQTFEAARLLQTHSGQGLAQQMSRDDYITAVCRLTQWVM